MQHTLHAEGFGVRLRPVRMEDAAFIVWLRNLVAAYDMVAYGKMRYNLGTVTSQTYQGVFTRDDLRSRAQAQIGIRFSF